MHLQKKWLIKEVVRLDTTYESMCGLGVLATHQGEPPP